MSDLCDKIGHTFGWKGICERCGWSSNEAKYRNEIERLVLDFQERDGRYRCQLQRQEKQIRKQSAENKRLLADVDDLHTLTQRQANLLSRTAIAIRGPEPLLRQWSHADVPERAAKLKADLEECRKLLREACEPGPAINWVDWIRRAKTKVGVE